MQPKTPKQVCDRLIRKGWNPSVVFYEGAKDCRNLSAALIRSSLLLLRTSGATGKEIRVLVEAVKSGAQDEVVKETWRAAIDALRALCRTSPTGTKRERDILLKIARDKDFVRALMAAASSEPEIDPSWMAVLTAEGSPESLASVKRQMPRYSGHPDLFDAIASFTGAIPKGSNSQSAVKTQGNGSSLPIQIGGGAFTKAHFWALIDGASVTTDPVGTLSEWLNEMKPGHIAAFARHFAATMDRSHRSDLWGAAYLLHDGCSDDFFSDFRASLILRGKKVFERVLKTPDALADHTDVEGDETIVSLLAEIYEAKMGRPFPSRRISTEMAPAGPYFDFDDKEEMRSRYPRLFALKATGRRS